MTYFTIISADEFRKNKEKFPNYREILHSIGSIRYCKAEVFTECVLGQSEFHRKMRSGSH
ncbi:MAG: hypothetical protein MSA09_07920 [Lachnospiraceae bacterium]|nr:hypothetical protein [Lachnospiraceae bacterium]